MRLCLGRTGGAHERGHDLASIWADTDFWDGLANSFFLHLRRSVRQKLRGLGRSCSRVLGALEIPEPAQSELGCPHSRLVLQANLLR